MRASSASALAATVGSLSALSFLVALGACGGGSGGAAPDAATTESDASLDAPAEVATQPPQDASADAAEATAPSIESGAPPTDAMAAPDAADSGFQVAPHKALDIPNSGGPVLAHPTLVTITFAGDGERSFAEGLDGYLVGSPWLGAVGPEYGIGLGTHVPVELSQSAPSTIDDTDIQALIASLILQGLAPAPTGGATIPVPPGTPFDAVDGGAYDAGSVMGADAGDAGLTATLLPAVYMVYVPTTTTETLDGGDLCQFSAGGYHGQAQGSINGLTFAYAVVSQCPGSSQASLQTTVSHEFIEAATDPAPYTDPGWAIQDPNNVWSSFGGEVGDLCSFVSPQWAEGSYGALQRVYSDNAAAAGGDPCVPSAGPYFAADVEPQTWMAVAAGSAGMFTIQGWSTTPLAPWTLSVENYIGQPTSFAPMGMVSTSMLDNGQSATLTVQVPAGSASGSSALLLVSSAQNTVHYEYALIGVYVP